MTTNRRLTKKQHKENGAVKSAKAAPALSVGDVGLIKAKSSAAPAESAHPLMAEVESFLGRRGELAKKLAEEIQATEKKLAELKKIAASLFPENVNHARADRKAKKRKDKSSSRTVKTNLAVATETPPTTESAS